MKIKFIEIENFQSIVKLRLGDFRENEVVSFEGDNDIGKSAIMLAIGILFYNHIRRGIDSLVRDGCSTFKVTVGSHSNHIISTERGAKNNYTLIYPDGSRFHTAKLDGSVPKEVRDVINTYIDPVSENILNYRTQDNSLLGVNNTGSELYSIVQYAINTFEIKEGIDRANAELKEFKDKVSEYNYMESMEKIAISKIRVVDEYDFKVAREALVKVKEIINMTEKCIKVEKDLELIDSRLAKVNDIDSNYCTINDTIKVIEITDGLLAKNNELSSLPKIDIDLDDLTTKSKKVKYNLEVVHITNRLIENIALRDSIDKKLDKINDVLNTDLDNVINLKVFTEKLISKVFENKQNKNNLQKVIKNLQEEEAEEVKLLNKMGVCPVCKQSTKELIKLGKE